MTKNAKVFFHKFHNQFHSLAHFIPVAGPSAHYIHVILPRQSVDDSLGHSLGNGELLTLHGQAAIERSRITKLLGLLNTLRLRQNGRHFPDNIFKYIFWNENAWISVKISLKFVLKGPINNIPASVQIMGWRRPGDKSLSAPVMVCLLTNLYVSLGLNELSQVSATHLKIPMSCRDPTTW